MATILDGFRLTLPSGEVYEAIASNVEVQVEHTQEWILSGGNTVIGVASGLFDAAGAGGTLQTPLATGHVGWSAGSRVFEFRFDRHKDSADSWGTASAGDPLLEQLGTFDIEVAQSDTSSLAPATLEWGPFLSGASGKYDAIPVIVQQVSPSLDSATQASSFRGGVTLAETIDLTKEIDGSSGPGTSDYTLSSPSAADDVPIAADTLGAGGRGTGVQTQGFSVSPSGLAEKNQAGGSSSATSTQTKNEPRDVTLRGAFRGASATDLAKRLRDQYLNNPDVDTVTLSSSRAAPTPLTGDYSLGPNSHIDPIVPQEDGGLYGFQLNLIQQ